MYAPSDASAAAPCSLSRRFISRSSARARVSFELSEAQPEHADVPIPGLRCCIVGSGVCARERNCAPSVVTTRFWSCDVPGRLCWIASSSRRRPPPSRVSDARRSRWPFAVPARAISAANDPIGHEDAIDGAGAGAGAKSSRLARRMRCPGGPLAAASTS